MTHRKNIEVPGLVAPLPSRRESVQWWSRWLAPLFALVLRKLPKHKSRKRFAKTFGPVFSGSVAETAYGFPLVCNWYDNANRKIFEGSYGVVADFIRSLPPGSLFIDIGANQGGTSILAARVLRQGGHVMAYEPNPHIAELMQENIALNACQNISLCVQAVGPEPKEMKLDASDADNSGSAHIGEEGIDITVAPIKFNDIPSAYRNAPVFVKIDTEGFEMEVLKGLEGLLSKKLVRKLIIEIDEANLGRFGTSPLRIYRFLEQHGLVPEQGLSPGHYDEVFNAQ